jgi:hypothetical protein
MPTKIRDANGNEIGFLQKRGEQIFILSPQGEESIGQFGDAIADTLDSKKTEGKVPYRDKEGHLQGWICQEGEKIVFRGLSGTIDGYYEKKGNRVICRGANGSVVSAFEPGPERDELFGSLEEVQEEQKPTPISSRAHSSVGAGTIASTGLLGGCLATGSLPLIFGLLFALLVIAIFFSPVFVVIFGLMIWYLIRELKKPDTNPSRFHHKTLVIILIIVGILELQSIGCAISTLERFAH